MRVSIASILLVGGVLALGACATPAEPDDLARAAWTECQGPGTRLTPTGRQTGDARQDYRCVSVHARADRPRARDNRDGRNAAVDRSLRRAT